MNRLTAEPKDHRVHRRVDREVKRTSENFPSETVWKIGMGPESGLRRSLKGHGGGSIGCLLPSRTYDREAFSYFPNGVRRGFLGTSPKRRSEKFALGGFSEIRGREE